MPEKKSTKTGLIGADTSFLIDFFTGDQKAALAMQKYASQLHVSELVLYEFLCGNLTETQEKTFFTAIQPFPQAPFTRQAAIIAAKLYREQKKKGKPVGHQDTMIAASYLAHGVSTIITKNTSHFTHLTQTATY